MTLRFLFSVVLLTGAGVSLAGPNVAIGVTVGGPVVPYYRPIPAPFFAPPLGYWRPYPPAWVYPPYYSGVYVAPIVATPVVVVEKTRPVIIESPAIVQYPTTPVPPPIPAPVPTGGPPTAAGGTVGSSQPLPLPAGAVPLPPPPAPYYPRQ